MCKNILHLFQWKLADIEKNLLTIKEQGFNSILISPVQPFKNQKENNWYWCYQPLSFSIGNKFGTKEELKNLCDTSHKLGIEVYIDVVVTHVASTDDNNLLPHKDVDKKLLSNQFWWKEKKLITDWSNRWEVTNLCYGVPCLDTKNYELQEMIIDFMNELLSCGADGFRIDSAKSISLPNEDNNHFFIRVLNSLNLTRQGKKPFVMAELIFMKKELLNQYTRYCYALTNSFCDNKDKCVVYVESHDSYLDDTIGFTKNMTDEMLLKEYDILKHKTEYKNFMFYTRPYSDLWKSDSIKKINERRQFNE